MGDEQADSRAVAFRDASPTRYWEDLAVGTDITIGPYTITEAEFDTFLGLSHEYHPIHSNPDFARQTNMGNRVLPGTFVHSVAAGRSGQASGYDAIVCVRSAHYDYLRPLHADEPFYVRTEIIAATIVDDRLGTVELRRRVLDANRTVLSIGRLNNLIMRRP